MRDGRSFMVTGGCGFIGSHLVRRLLARGARRVVVVDNLRYGSLANLGAASAEVELLSQDLGGGDAGGLAEAIGGIDYLFHFAAEKHNQSLNDPLRVLRSNIEGTWTLLDAAARAGVRKVIFASSLYVYGRMSGPPFREDEVPRPATVYGISKLAGEHLLAHFLADRGLPYNALRFLFVYGPRQYAGTGYRSVIVANFERLLRGEPPVVRGDGRQALDYVYVDDAVSAAVAALETGVSGEAFNVGSAAAVTVEDLTALMQSVAGTSLAPRREAADRTAGSVRVADIEKAGRLLGWRPQTTLRQGLERTLAWLSGRAA